MGRFLKTLNLQNFENNISRPKKVHSYYTRSKTIPSDERTNSSAKPAKKKYILILASSAKIPESTRDVARKVKRQSSIFNVRIAPAFNAGSKCLNSIENVHAVVFDISDCEKFELSDDTDKEAAAPSQPAKLFRADMDLCVDVDKGLEARKKGLKLFFEACQDT